ncbi:hypothetical protein Pelo_14933 [Pelomyxa schiedti]|nr:hypothetical protein Pelo_14933 [Pelomyxa schiedti]
MQRRLAEAVTRACIVSTLQNQGGVVFAAPAIVHRPMYCGRNIVQGNNDTETDDRGYFAVEWWIMSLTHALNAKPKDGEGISRLILPGTAICSVGFLDAVTVAENELLGAYRALWPLTKILDIGGKPVSPSFAPDKPEVPGIPCHTHSGVVRRKTDGGVELLGPGKLEAYFFPPLSVPPYNLQNVSAITRLGLKPGVSKEQLIAALKRFGRDDSCYPLLEDYQINAYDAWTLPPGILHAPGPWTTFEIQRPQDDANLASWRLGIKIPEDQLATEREVCQLKGLRDETEFVEHLLNWELCTAPDFRQRFQHKVTSLEHGSWGNRIQIFFGVFYGEAFEVAPGATFKREADIRPFAGICWSGKGTLNGNTVDVSDPRAKEFLVVPRVPVTIVNTGLTPLLMFTVFPMTSP